MDSNTALLQNLSDRYATKAFNTNKKISAETLEALTDSLVLTPSSFGLQPWKFYIITDQATKDSLLPHSWNQPQITQCSHLIVLAAQSSMTEAHVDAFLQLTADTRGGVKQDLDQYRQIILGFLSNMTEEQILLWNQKQVYVALGQLLLSAATLGIDTCPMEGIIPSKYDEILKLEGTNYSTVLACPIGYRAADDKHASLEKVRFPKEQIVSHL